MSGIATLPTSPSRVSGSRSTRAATIATARPNPCRPYQRHGAKAKHQPHQHKRPIVSPCQPPSTSGQALGAARCTKLVCQAADAPVQAAAGGSDQGQAAAQARPTSVPGTVISSGMICSSISISDAAAISTMRIIWATKAVEVAASRLSVGN